MIRGSFRLCAVGSPRRSSRFVIPHGRLLVCHPSRLRFGDAGDLLFIALRAAAKGMNEDEWEAWMVSNMGTSRQ